MLNVDCEMIYLFSSMVISKGQVIDWFCDLIDLLPLI
jgi:hypothetical protein